MNPNREEALVVLALNIFYTLLPVIFAPVPMKIIGLVAIALYVFIISLVLRSTDKPIEASA